MIRTYEKQGILTLDIAGPATMIESPAVHDAARTSLSRGVRCVRIDLRDCTTMDSTFSGTILSLKRELEELGGALTLVSPSARVLELLREMGLEDFYAIEVGERPVGPCRTIATATPEVATLRRRILDAHEELLRVPGAPGDAFSTVVEELRRDAPASTKNFTGGAPDEDRESTWGPRRPSSMRRPCSPEDVAPGARIGRPPDRIPSAGEPGLR